MTENKIEYKTQTDNEPRIVRKLRPLDIMGKKIRAPEKWEGEHYLYTIFGKANGTRAGQSTFGEFQALRGVFEAQRVNDGTRFLAKECFLPEPMHSHIVDTINAMIEKKETPFVEFAFKIGLKQADTDRGYEYVTVALIRPKSSDELGDLRARALTAPVADIKDKPEIEVKKPYKLPPSQVKTAEAKK
jgi:hypothetical protein